MKSYFIVRGFALFIFMAAFLSFLISCPSFAQDLNKEKSKKATIIVKIDKDENGKTTRIDTSFNLTDSSQREAFREYMKQYKGDMDALHHNLENIEVYVDISDLPDSLELDSLEDHLLLMSKDIHPRQFRFHQAPRSYDYEFDIPCPPDFPPPPVDMEWFDWHGMEPGLAPRMFRYGDEDHTLSDILHDIPMDRIKSYSIKERKNGKRIIIDIEDAPLIENKERMIIIREPQTPYPPHTPKAGTQKKIIIKVKPEEEKEKVK